MPTIGWFEILIVVAIAIVVLGPKDFPLMLKKAGSWIGTAKRYISDIQNEVSNIDIDDEKINEIKSKSNERFKNFFITKNNFNNLEKAHSAANELLNELKKIIEKKYPNILDINFDQKESQQNFWFISKNKEEPRLADRFEEHGSELEQPLAIARDIKNLYEKLLLEKENLTIAQFLSSNSEFRHVIRRAFIVEKFPYSEIQDNTIGKDIIPIDMLRLKLSFFGALKFDPRSDKWLRICMFQGAPLPTELKNYDEQWVYKTNN